MIFPYDSLYIQAVAYTTYFKLGAPVAKVTRRQESREVINKTPRKWTLKKSSPQPVTLLTVEIFFFFTKTERHIRVVGQNFFKRSFGVFSGHGESPKTFRQRSFSL